MPSLHIGLGVFKRIYDEMEVEANKIDAKIYSHRVTSSEEEEEEDDLPLADLTPKNNFEQAIHHRIAERTTICQAIEQKETEVEDLFDDLPLAGLKHGKQFQDKVSSMLGEIGRLRQDISELVRINFQRPLG